jgi:outer membrane lipoprotein-sorting protein
MLMNMRSFYMGIRPIVTFLILGGVAVSGFAQEVEMVESPPPPLDHPVEVLQGMSTSTSYTLATSTAVNNDASTDALDLTPPDDQLSSATEAMNRVPGAEPPEKKLSPEELFLNRLQENYGEVTTVKGEFLQKRISDIFQDELETLVEFYVRKPELFHMKYGEPDNTEEWINSGIYYQVIPEYKTASKYLLSREAGSMESLYLRFLGFDIKTEDIFSVYRVSLVNQEAQTRTDEQSTETSTTLALIPLEPNTNLKYLNISFVEKTPAPKNQPACPLPSHIFYRQASGDTTDIKFQELFFNEPLDDELFEPRIPEGYEIDDNTQQ